MVGVTKEHRAALLDTPTLDYDQLAQLRQDSRDVVRAWVGGNAGRLLAVTHDRRTLLPAFQFDDSGELRENIGRINALLNTDTTMSDWSRWAWWHARTSYLSGRSPLDLVDSDHERVLRAAHRMTRHDTAGHDARILREHGPADDLDELEE